MNISLSAIKRLYSQWNTEFALSRPQVIEFCQYLVHFQLLSLILYNGGSQWMVKKVHSCRENYASLLLMSVWMCLDLIE